MGVDFDKCEECDRILSDCGDNAVRTVRLDGDHVAMCCDCIDAHSSDWFISYTNDSRDYVVFTMNADTKRVTGAMYVDCPDDIECWLHHNDWFQTDESIVVGFSSIDKKHPERLGKFRSAVDYILFALSKIDDEEEEGVYDVHGPYPPVEVWLNFLQKEYSDCIVSSAVTSDCHENLERDIRSFTSAALQSKLHEVNPFRSFERFETGGREYANAETTLVSIFRPMDFVPEVIGLIFQYAGNSFVLAAKTIKFTDGVDFKHPLEQALDDYKRAKRVLEQYAEGWESNKRARFNELIPVDSAISNAGVLEQLQQMKRGTEVIEVVDDDDE